MHSIPPSIFHVSNNATVGDNQDIFNPRILIFDNSKKNVLKGMKSNWSNYQSAKRCGSLVFVPKWHSLLHQECVLDTILVDDFKLILPGGTVIAKTVAHIWGFSTTTGEPPSIYANSVLCISIYFCQQSTVRVSVLLCNGKADPRKSPSTVPLLWKKSTTI